MRAVVYKSPGHVEVSDVPEPHVAEATDAIVKVTHAGICGTDLHVVKGDFAGITPGAVVGHEFVGEVVEAGRAVHRIRLGDKVMSSDFTACGQCRWCDRAEHWQCTERAFFGTGTAFGPSISGAQAEYVRVPFADQTLGHLPEQCPPEAALLMGDNLATGWVAIERASTQAGDFVVVIGGGAVGQLAALSAQVAGAGVVVLVEPNETRRAFANAQGSIAVHPDDAAALVRKLTDGDGAEVVVEAVGGNGTLDFAMSLARARGRVVSVGAHVAESWAFPVGRAFRDELTLSFAIGDSIRLRRKLLRLVTSGALDPTVVVDARGRLTDAPSLYDLLARQQRMKAVMTP
ncbi:MULTISPECIES: alcohol dehydrogenase catalytic domain-containing protein [Piscinibacter]|jgi:2-desacetyl-2-hydroxyethyl bacteriochlorophyllide A dehydrogenase|uniref:alcohol dehydrogenase catalytic domain-containing protein n=1 Tax=Piscinibacter TaxID=1114981 RepID=UPI000FDF3CA1